MKNTLLLTVALSFLSTLSLASADEGAIRERGTNRKITFAIENGVATFSLVDGENRREIRRLEVTSAQDARLDPAAFKISKFERTRMVSEGYIDLTDWLIDNLELGIIFMPYVSGPAYVGYSTSYLYSIPADVVAPVRRKYLKLIRGEEVKASKKLFRALLEKLGG